MNAKIIEQFNELVKQIQAEYLNAQMENDIKEINTHSFRLKQVKKILNILRKLDFKITTGDDLKGIPGIGAGTIKRVNEIIENGYLAELEQKYGSKKMSKIRSIQDLSKVIGIGEKGAQKLVTNFGIKSVEDLKKAIKKNKIQVNDKVILGLKYYGVVEGNIPRKEIADTEKYLKKKAKEIDSKLEIIICGSYRRGKSTSGDIDVLMYHPDAKTSKDIRNPKLHNLKPYLEDYVDDLTESGFLLDHLTDKNYKMKYMGFSKYKSYPVRRIDIRFVPFKSLPAATLYFTGPYELNEEMRHQAKKRGMLLNEYGLYKINKNETRTRIDIESEKDIFEALGMKYLTPKERESFSTGKAKKTKV